MANIQLNYLYRDGANYKQFGFVVFSNPNGITIEKATDLLRSKLISNEFFMPQDWDLPRLQLYPFDPEIDHQWHEFENFEFTDSQPTDEREVEYFLDRIKKGYEI